MDFKRLERQRSQYYRIAERQFYEALMSQINDVIKSGTIDPETAARLIIDEPIRDKFQYIYQRTGGDFAEQVYNKFSGGGLRETFDHFMKNYVELNCGNKITSITEVSRTQAKKVIRQVLADNGTMGTGDLSREISKALKKEGGRISRWRARAIARTEVETASNVGQQAGAEQVGVPMMKTWLHSGGRDARVSHEHMNGKSVGMNEYFNVDGVQMYTPCDPQAPAEHVINCRCGLTYEVIKI